MKKSNRILLGVSLLVAGAAAALGATMASGSRPELPPLKLPDRTTSKSGDDVPNLSGVDVPNLEVLRKEYRSALERSSICVANESAIKSAERGFEGLHLEPSPITSSADGFQLETTYNVSIPKGMDPAKLTPDLATAASSTIELCQIREGVAGAEKAFKSRYRTDEPSLIRSVNLFSACLKTAHLISQELIVTPNNVREILLDLDMSAPALGDCATSSPAVFDASEIASQ